MIQLSVPEIEGGTQSVTEEFGQICHINMLRTLDPHPPTVKDKVLKKTFFDPFPQLVSDVKMDYNM